MDALRTSNRAMFWRIIRRLFGANPGRLFVMLLALGAGAAVTAALLNLQVDAKRRLTSEFRALGGNVVIAPRASSSPSNATLLDGSILGQLPPDSAGKRVRAVAFLYAIGNLSIWAGKDVDQKNAPHMRAILVGASPEDFSSILPAREVQVFQGMTSGQTGCQVGASLAEKLHLQVGQTLLAKTDNGGSFSCWVISVLSFGGPEDGQVFVYLPEIQSETRNEGLVSLIQLSVPGTPQEIRRYVADLQQKLPGADVHGIRQFTEGEAKIYNRISGLLTATVGIVLVLTGLCVMAAMTNVAMERKNDVGLMKAIGGSMRRVLRLFLAEAALLGLAGGIIGSAAGIFLSIGLGKAVFGVAARPRLIVYPVAVALTIIVAIISAFPLRRLASIRPASVFRGEA